LSIKVLQGNVATRLRCGGIFNDIPYTITSEPEGEIILKISQYLPKLWARIVSRFLTHWVVSNKYS